MSVTQGFQSQAVDLHDIGIQKLSHGMTNVPIPEVNMLKHRSILAVSAPINISIKLDYVFVNGTRETYFVDVFVYLRV